MKSVCVAENNYVMLTNHLAVHFMYGRLTVEAKLYKIHSLILCSRHSPNLDNNKLFSLKKKNL